MLPCTAFPTGLQSPPPLFNQLWQLDALWHHVRRGDPPAQDPPQLPSSPDTVAGCFDRHRRHTHRKATAGLHPHHATACETMRCSCPCVQLRPGVPEGYLKEEDEAPRTPARVCDAFRSVPGITGWAFQDLAQLEESLERLLPPCGQTPGRAPPMTTMWGSFQPERKLRAGMPCVSSFLERKAPDELFADTSGRNPKPRGLRNWEPGGGVGAGELSGPFTHPS